MHCAKCQKPLDPWGFHSEICATAEATRGHYAVASEIHDACKIVDPGASQEPRGLCADEKRPADILSFAPSGGGKNICLDVAIVSEEARYGKGDALRAATNRKWQHYGGDLDDLHKQ